MDNEELNTAPVDDEIIGGAEPELEDEAEVEDDDKDDEEEVADSFDDEDDL